MREKEGTHSAQVVERIKLRGEPTVDAQGIYVDVREKILNKPVTR
jgi:hypothetical protein